MDDLSAWLKQAASVALTASTADEAMRRALDLVCEWTGWPLGHVLRTDGADGTLQSTGIWHDDAPARHAAFVAASEQRTFAVGEGLPGRIAATREPAWISDVRVDADFPRLAAARESGVVAAFGFPILSRRGVEGVMEFFAAEPADPDERMLQFASQIGMYLGGALAFDEVKAWRIRLEEAQRLAHIGSWTWDAASDSVRWSDELHRIYGLEPGASPVSLTTYLERVHPDDRGRVASAVANTLATLEPYEHGYRIVRPDGDVRWVHARGEVGEVRGGAAVRLGGYCHDVTAQKQAEERRSRVQEELAGHRRVLERIARGEPFEATLALLCQEVEQRYPEAACTVLLVDDSERVLRHAAAPSLATSFVEAIDGLPITRGMGACGQAASTGETVVVDDTLTSPLTAAFVELAETHDLRSVWSQPLLSAAKVVLGTFAVYRGVPHHPDPEEAAVVSAAANLAALAIERHRTEAALTLAAQADPLTGLPNRARFLHELQACLRGADASVAVMFLDLDGFKWINDSLGHQAGDRVLTDVADRFRHGVGARHTVARFGGDEFTVLIDQATPTRVGRAADAVRAAFVEPFLLDGGEFFLSVSIGIARNDETSDAYGLDRDADAAMYAAKESGRGHQAFFHERLRQRAVARVNLESELRRAVERDEFVLHYQPIVDLASGRWCGAEALVRWQHPRRGLTVPNAFIPLAEETGLIVPLGLRILDRAVAEAATWPLTDPPLYVAANLSAVQVADPALASEIADLLAWYSVAPECLVVEVTESAVMEHLDTARSVLGDLAALGVRAFIDDFGTGHSSIARLGELPVAGIKIDQSFTGRLGRDAEVVSVLAAITELGHALGLHVIIEGIETEAALHEVAALGCDAGQGYHVSLPLPAPDFLRRISPPAAPG